MKMGRILALILTGIVLLPLIGYGHLLWVLGLILVGLVLKKTRTFSLGLLLGMVMLFVVFLIGFYTTSYVVGEFDAAGTWVPDRHITTAVDYFSHYPGYIVGSLFGLNSNTSYGHNNSDSLLLLGIVASDLLILSGVPLFPKLQKTLAKR